MFTINVHPSVDRLQRSKDIYRMEEDLKVLRRQDTLYPGRRETINRIRTLVNDLRALKN